MKTVVGLFDRYEDAEHTVNLLEYRGFHSKRFGMLGVRSEGAMERMMGKFSGFGTLMVPNIGSVFAIGKLATNLDSMSDTPGVTAQKNDLISLLISLDISEHEAHEYEKGVGCGSILLTVQAEDDQVQEVVSIMFQKNAARTNIPRKNHAQPSS